MFPILSWKTHSFVLVEQWKTSSFYGLLAAMLVSCLASGLYEFLRRYLQNWDKREHVVCSGTSCRTFNLLTLRLLRSGLHALSASVSYILMLFLMTYNTWVLISCLIGASLGYFFLAPRVILPLSSPNQKSLANNSRTAQKEGSHTLSTLSKEEAQLLDHKLQETKELDTNSSHSVDMETSSLPDVSGGNSETKDSFASKDNLDTREGNPESALLPKRQDCEAVVAPNPVNSGSSSAEERLDLLMEYIKSEIG